MQKYWDDVTDVELVDIARTWLHLVLDGLLISRNGFLLVFSEVKLIEPQIEKLVPHAILKVISVFSLAFLFAAIDKFSNWYL